MIDLLDKLGHRLGKWWEVNTMVVIYFFFLTLYIIGGCGLMYKGITVGLKDYFDTKDYYEGCLNYHAEKTCTERYYGD